MNSLFRVPSGLPRWLLVVSLASCSSFIPGLCCTWHSLKTATLMCYFLISMTCPRTVIAPLVVWSLIWLPSYVVYSCCPGSLLQGAGNKICQGPRQVTSQYHSYSFFHKADRCYKQKWLFSPREFLAWAACVWGIHIYNLVLLALEQGFLTLTLLQHIHLNSKCNWSNIFIRLWWALYPSHFHCLAKWACVPEQIV